jgi:hypothetical protein
LKRGVVQKYKKLPHPLPKFFNLATSHLSIIDPPDTRSDHGNHKNPSLFEVGCVICNMDTFTLFPERSQDLGRRYEKGYSYVKATLFCSARDKNRSLQTCGEAFEQLIQQVKEELMVK